MDAVTSYVHENSKQLNSVLKEAAKFSRQLELDLNNENDNHLQPTKAARKAKKAAKNNGLKQLESTWHEKPLHGKFAARSKNADVNGDPSVAEELRTERGNRRVYFCCPGSEPLYA